MKKIKRAIALMLGIVMAASVTAVPSFAAVKSAEAVEVDTQQTVSVADVFDDVDADAWYMDTLQYVYDHELMSGTDGKFSPDKTVTRAMVVTTLYNVEGKPEVTDYTACEELKDLSAGQWYTDAVCWAYNNGVATGNDVTKTFHADATVTREQLATFFYRYAEYKGFYTQQAGDLSALLNADQVSDYAEEAVVWAVGVGLISGSETTDADGNIVYDLAPKAGATRAQLATILMRFCEEYGVFEEESSEDVTDDTSTEQMGDATGTLVYFPVTMYDYDYDTYKNATNNLEIERNGGELPSKWTGMYFGGSSEVSGEGTLQPDVFGGETTKERFVDGQYYIQCARAAGNGAGSWLKANGTLTRSGNILTGYSYSVTESSITSTVDQAEATLWTLEQHDDGKFSLKTTMSYKPSWGSAVPVDVYLNIAEGENGDTLTTSEVRLNIDAYSGAANSAIGNHSECVEISSDSYALNHWGGGQSTAYGGYTVEKPGNAMRFYRVEGSETTLVTMKNGESVTVDYAIWNSWGKGATAAAAKANGDLMYTGLVQSKLVNNQIVFNQAEAGIFDANTTVKDIYEYVGLPFVVDDRGHYVFDSDENSVYFADVDNDGTADPQSGTAENPYNLYFEGGTTQPLKINVGDGSTNAWFPYNIYNRETDRYTEATNYHFGMRADLPFALTANGRVNSADEDSEAIKFTFSGDDDVWVFVDDVLVIDLGGIHNRLDATIDFAANTITYSEQNAYDTNSETRSFNDETFQTTQQLFTTADAPGLIEKTREAFAVDEEHTLSVFYLERGRGTSNCRIEFNLPMNDTVLVTKDATQSWCDGMGDDTQKLTEAEQRVMDNIPFGFTLYAKGADDETFASVANTNFYLLDKQGEVIAINATDGNGHFYLKNGQTAKFITNIPLNGVTYYVVEDELNQVAFVTPDYNFAGQAAGGFDYVDKDSAGNVTVSGGHVDAGNQIPEQIIDVDATIYKSYEVTAKGSVEVQDSVQFICSNYMRSDLPNPTMEPMEDIIVIDYGLPVVIDPLANDIQRGNTEEILYVGSESVSITEVKDAAGNVTDVTVEDKGAIEFGNVTLVKSTPEVDDSRDTIIYELTKPLTEVEVLSYVAQATDGEGHSVTKIGKIYIVPATVMYYEENFNGLVKFANSANAKWNTTTTVTDSEAVSAYQEPGVVGTVDDSTYGSDVAYLSDSGDSNGTSHFGDTTNGPIRFAYTFTGTGTSFFARTSAETGYLQIKLYEGTTSTGDGYMKISYRDTYYRDENGSDEDAAGTLYNIPVYTESGLAYGTYTVVVTVAQAGTKTAGNPNGAGAEFYLDGIRIMQPLNEKANEELTEKALGAYATDGESNITVVTLREKIITDAVDGLSAWNFIVFTDTHGQLGTVDEYSGIGPKEEVYLNEGQSVSFAIKYWHQAGYKLYMGMKAPMGSATVQSGTGTKNLANATDCYYDITGEQLSIINKYEQAVYVDQEENEHLLFTDENGNEVYEDFVEVDGNAEFVYRYVDSGELVADDVELTPVDDVNQPYYIAVYTVKSIDGIAALTNIKVVGNYEFTLIENVDLDVDIDVDLDVDVDGAEGEE